MIGSSDNSGGVVVGALVCGTECSGFKSCLCFDFFFFSLDENFLSSCEPFQHGASIACCSWHNFEENNCQHCLKCIMYAGHELLLMRTTGLVHVLEKMIVMLVICT